MKFNLDVINLTPIVEAIIVLLGALITRRLLPMIKAKTSAEYQKKMLAVIDILVFAAEQLYGAGHGEEKLQYVEEELRERGFEVDRAAIEAAVYESINQFRDGMAKQPKSQIPTENKEEPTEKEED